MYKKLSIAILFLTSFSAKSFAQKTFFDLLINRVGSNLNYGNQNNSLKDYAKSAKGYQAGVSFQAGITPNFSLVSELYFIRKGGKLKANNPENKQETSLRINTIELPVLARFHFGKVYINAGPSIAVNLSGTSKIGKDAEEIKFENIKNGFKRLEAGIQFGGGIEIPIKERRISLDLRYNYGLTNISYDKEIYNRSFMVSIHFSKAWKKNPFGKNVN